MLPNNYTQAMTQARCRYMDIVAVLVPLAELSEMIIIVVDLHVRNEKLWTSHFLVFYE